MKFKWMDMFILILSIILIFISLIVYILFKDKSYISNSQTLKTNTTVNDNFNKDVNNKSNQIEVSQTKPNETEKNILPKEDTENILENTGIELQTKELTKSEALKLINEIKTLYPSVEKYNQYNTDEHLFRTIYFFEKELNKSEGEEIKMDKDLLNEYTNIIIKSAEELRESNVNN